MDRVRVYCAYNKDAKKPFSYSLKEEEVQNLIDKINEDELLAGAYLRSEEINMVDLLNLFLHKCLPNHKDRKKFFDDFFGRLDF